MRTLAKIVLLIFLTASCSTQNGVMASETHECIIVEDVEIATPLLGELDELELNLQAANSGHQLQSGSRTVLLLRIFSEKEGIADSQYFTKLTGYLSDADNLGEKELRLENGHFSSGWSGFAYRADFWVSEKVSVEINPLPGRKSEIQVAGVIDATNSYRRESKEFELHFTCRLSKRALTDLSPWEGGAGDLWNSFYP